MKIGLSCLILILLTLTGIEGETLGFIFNHIAVDQVAQLLRLKANSLEHLLVFNLVHISWISSTLPIVGALGAAGRGSTLRVHHPSIPLLKLLVVMTAAVSKTSILQKLAS